MKTTSIDLLNRKLKNAPQKKILHRYSIDTLWILYGQCMKNKPKNVPPFSSFYLFKNHFFKQNKNTKKIKNILVRPYLIFKKLIAYHSPATAIVAASFFCFSQKKIQRIARSFKTFFGFKRVALIILLIFVAYYIKMQLLQKQWETQQ